MKKADMKIIAIIVMVALFITVVTSNAVSIASVVFLYDGNNVQQGTVAGVQGDAAADNGANTGSDSGSVGNVSVDANAGVSADDSANTTPDAATPDNSVSHNTNANTSTDNNSSQSNANASSKNDAPASSNNGSNVSTSTNWSKEQTFNFYKKSAHAIASTGNASYDKIEYQSLDNLQVGSVGNLVQPVIDSFMTTEAEAKVQNCTKGDESKRRFPDCTLTDMSKVASATKKDLANGNYEITIIMADEDTPMNEQSSFLAKVTSSVLFWEDIEKTIKEDVSIVSQINSRSVNYKGYKIVAEMTKDGKFVSLGHFATVDIKANAKITFVTLDVGATLYNNCKYSNFKY